MRKTISILLALVFFFQSLGCLVIFKLQQLQVRYRVKHHLISELPDSELTLIKLSDEEANPSWQFLGSDELRYSGTMYDVVRKESHGEQTWCYCYRDTAETKVVNKLNNIVDDQMNHNPKRRKQRQAFHRLLKSLFRGHHQHPKVVHPFIASIRSLYSFQVKTWTAPPLTQPPQVT
mgnify:CR=1 FL=1